MLYIHFLCLKIYSEHEIAPSIEDLLRLQVISTANSLFIFETLFWGGDFMSNYEHVMFLEMRKAGYPDTPTKTVTQFHFSVPIPRK